MKQRKLKLSEVVGRGYASFWNSKQRYVVCKGGRGSKKSKTSALKLIVNLMAYKEANALVIRRYERTLRNSCYSDLVWAIHRLGVEEYWDFKVSPLEITHKLTGQKSFFAASMTRRKLRLFLYRLVYFAGYGLTKRIRLRTKTSSTNSIFLFAVSCLLDYGNSSFLR